MAMTACSLHSQQPAVFGPVVSWTTSVGVLSILALGGCAGGPAVTTGSEANPSAARGQLIAAAASGPVPLEIDSVPPVYRGGVTEVAAVASQAVDWLGVRFMPMPFGQGSERKRLVFRFEDMAEPAAEICTGKVRPGGLPPPPIKLHAVFCDGRRPVADTTGTASGTQLGDANQLITTTMDRLFPGHARGSPYYGFPGVSLGVGIGTGRHWGVGTGIFGGISF